MHIVATCPNCGTEVLVQTVECARCGRPATPGSYVIAPAGSRYENRPVCVACVDGHRADLPQYWGPIEPIGPTETK